MSPPIERLLAGALTGKLHFLFDDIFPNGLGRPILPNGLGIAPGI